MNNSSEGYNNPSPSNQNNNNFSPSNRRKKQSLWWIPVATILGFFAIIAIAFFSLIAYFSYSLEKFGSGFESKPVFVAENSILKLNFSNLSEVSSNENPFAIFSNKTSKPTFYQVIKAIKEAADDERILGIYYEGNSYLSGAMAKELQIALTDFKKSNKFIYSYLETASKGEYYTALVSDSIFVSDEGIYEFTGFGISTIFPKGLYDKLGLEFTVVQCEDFKTMAETYKNRKFSDSSRLSYKSLIAQRENEFITTVAEKRGLLRGKVIEYLSKGIIDADEMLELKLADAKTSKQTVMTFLAEKRRAEKSKKLSENKNKIKKSQFVLSANSNENNNEDEENEICTCSACMDIENDLVGIDDYVQNIKNRKFINAKNERIVDDTIAVICGEGTIVSTRTGSLFGNQESSIVSSEFVKLIKKAKNNDNVKGIIIRINSPGGSVIASEEIYQAILDAKTVKPVYASMSDVAASGGYYIAMACDTIIAHPSTITGSIGVVSVFPNVNKLLHYLYINVDTISNGIGKPFFLDPTLPRKQEDVIKFEKQVFTTYKRFLTKAAQCRKMSVAEMRSVAKGRVWTGEDAFQNGLVDALGNFQTAIDMMKVRIGRKSNETVGLIFMPDSEDKWKAFLKLFDEVSLSGIVDAITGRISANNKQELSNSLMIPQEVQKQLTYLQNLAIISEKEKFLMAMPNLIEIK
jgi:protease-4